MVPADEVDFDLKCKEKVSDSETDQESESETFSKHKIAVTNAGSTVEMVEAQLRQFSQDDSDGSKFVLGPTPAQQKRVPPDDVLDDAKFKSKISSLPEFQPGNSQSKLPSLQTSPQLFIQSYRKKRSGIIKSIHEPDNLGSDAETPNKSGTPSNGFFDSTPKSTGSTPLSTLSGQRFFGPDFNPDNFNIGREENGETSPFCGDGTASKSGPSNLRRTLDHRRQLVMQLFHDQGLFPSNQATSEFQLKHADVFPNKLCLQLKIREVRQKMMAQNSAESPSAHNNNSSIPVENNDMASPQPLLASSSTK